MPKDSSSKHFLRLLEGNKKDLLTGPCWTEFQNGELNLALNARSSFRLGGQSNEYSFLTYEIINEWRAIALALIRWNYDAQIGGNPVRTASERSIAYKSSGFIMFIYPVLALGFG